MREGHIMKPVLQGGNAGSRGADQGMSRECRQALDTLFAWSAEVLAYGKSFDFQQARHASKLYVRSAEEAAKNSFRADGVLAEWVRAPWADPDSRILYLHGGGYISGDLDTTLPFARLISQATGCSVLAIDYRLAPENPFPHALDDAVRAYGWLRDNGPHGPGGAKTTVIAGDSAGGGLALSTLLRLREDRAAPPDCAVTLSALTDLSLSGASLMRREGDDPVLTYAFLQLCSQAYASGTDPKHPLISPLFADLRGLPPLFMQVGGREVLLDDTLRFVKKARDAGVDVTLDLWPHMFHSWQLFAPDVPEARQSLERVGAFVKGVGQLKRT